MNKGLKALAELKCEFDNMSLAVYGKSTCTHECNLFNIAVKDLNKFYELKGKIKKYLLNEPMQSYEEHLALYKELKEMSNDE